MCPVKGVLLFLTCVQRDGGVKKGRGKKGKRQAVVNVKNSPVSLRDGDTLGLKVCSLVPQ